MGIRQKGYVEEMLKTVGLENTDRNKACASYSLGMRQRLGIALALVGDPKLIILDEPINGLDPQGIAEMRETLVKLRDEKGLISYGLGDWLQPGRGAGDPVAPVILTSSVISCYIAYKSEMLFGALGLEMQRKFAASLKEIKACL